MSKAESTFFTAETPNNIAILGSAFNPPTLGHLSVIKGLAHFDKILLVPSIHHAWGKAMAPFERRCEWVSSFIKDTQLSALSLCTAEQEIYQGQAVTTWALLNHLQQQYADARLTFVIGPDNLFNFHKFYNAERILTQWSLLCCPQTLDIRSSMIREALARGEKITELTTSSLSKQLQAQDFVSWIE